MDIADRIDKRRRATRLIEEGRRLREGEAVEAFVLMSEGSPKRLEDLAPDLLDLVAEMRMRPAPRTGLTSWATTSSPRG
jgi:hypothetical protein